MIEGLRFGVGAPIELGSAAQHIISHRDVDKRECRRCAAAKMRLQKRAEGNPDVNKNGPKKKKITRLSR